MEEEARRAGRIVVLGAGMAGLLAAAAAADQAEEVVVVERDDLSDGTTTRPGTAQGRHVHALLSGGLDAIERLVPGTTDELGCRGAQFGDVLLHTRMCFGGHRLMGGPSGLTLVSASRALIEASVGAGVAHMANVRLVTRCDAAGLVSSGDGSRIAGVRLLRRQDSSAEEVVEADLVVDATGRTSRIPAWLDALGLPTPPEERVVVDVAYASQRFRLRPGALGGHLNVIHGPTAATPRAGALALIEDEQALVTLAGMLGDRPPLDPAGFVAWARTLQFDDIAEALRDAEPLGAPVPHRFPASTWRHYERVRRPPLGLAVVGDGVCSVNPIYGQGMSLAATEAVALRRHLRRHGTRRPRLLHRSIAQVVRSPWQMAAGGDLQFAGVEGRRTRSQRLVARYVARLHAAAASDVRLSEAFVRVAGMVDQPQALLRPRVAGRVLRAVDLG